MGGYDDKEGRRQDVGGTNSRWVLTMRRMIGGGRGGVISEGIRISIIIGIRIRLAM